MHGGIMSTDSETERKDMPKMSVQKWDVRSDWVVAYIYNLYNLLHFLSTRSLVLALILQITIIVVFNLIMVDKITYWNEVCV